jgi:hypothetical protein
LEGQDLGSSSGYKQTSQAEQQSPRSHNADTSDPHGASLFWIVCPTHYIIMTSQKDLSDSLILSESPAFVKDFL